MTGDARPSPSPSTATPGGPLLAAVLDELDDGVALLSDDDEILLANAAFRGLAAPSGGPVVGVRLQALLTTVPALEAPPLGVPSWGGWEGRVRVGPSETPVDFAPAFVRRVPVAHGPELRLFVVETKGGHARCLARIRRAEGASRVARATVHELNNALAAVTAFAELLAMTRPDGPAGDQDRADLDEIRRAARRGAEITRRLSAFSAPVHGAPEVLDVGAALRAQEGVLRRLMPTGGELIVDLPESGPWARHDPRSLDRLLVDLMLDLTESGDRARRLRIGASSLTTASTERLGEATLPPGSWVVLEVEGMDAVPAGESAVGSARAAGLAAVHDGVHLRIYLPAVDGGESEAEGAEGPPAAALTVLLVEPDPALRRALRRGLARHGFSILDVSEVDEALTLVRDGGLRPDGVVMEAAAGSPSASDFEASIRSLGLGAPFVFVSGRPDDPGVEALRRSGVPVLAKPVEAAELARTLRGAVGARQGAP